MRLHFSIPLCLFMLLAGMTGTGKAQPPKREVRAVWLTTIGGLDWPRSKANNASGTERQKKELTDILDRLQAARFNTVFLQTRIRSTVIYPSQIEPWDDCLTGHTDKDPGYDPLAFAIEECHKRHLELHAWVVAFPGNSFAKAKALGRKAMQRRLPGMCIKTNDNWMLNPGEPATANYLASICHEITRNYDIDGIHLDYMRYPEKEVRFNDAATYRKYGNGLPLATWRRNNVSKCAEAVHAAVKRLKPWVRVSCSPIGKHDDLPRFTSKGWNAYATVYQDAQSWLQKGWMDMLVPMMYFQGNHFFPFAQDWIENSYGRIIVPGLAAYFLAKGQKDWPLDIIERENHVVRIMGASGQAYFRSRFVTENTKGIYDFLKNCFYPTPAFTPALTWEKTERPPAPTGLHIARQNGKARLIWDAPANRKDITYNIYSSFVLPVDTGNTENLVAYGLRDTGFDLGTDIPDTYRPHYAVTIMDRYGNESKPACLDAPRLHLSGPICNGRLSLKGDTLLLPAKNREEYLLLTDMSGRIVSTLPYTERMDIHPLKPGLYDIRTLEKKGKSHFLGRLFRK